jgi:hypothetical protein
MFLKSCLMYTKYQGLASRFHFHPNPKFIVPCTFFCIYLSQLHEKEEHCEQQCKAQFQSFPPYRRGEVRWSTVPEHGDPRHTPGQQMYAAHWMWSSSSPCHQISESMSPHMLQSHFCNRSRFYINCLNCKHIFSSHLQKREELEVQKKINYMILGFNHPLYLSSRTWGRSQW